MVLSYVEQNDILAEEQNGFRSNRACIDHIYTLCTILRHRKALGLSTYCCFIDFRRAFDSLDHDLLFYKLLSYGIKGNMYRAIKIMYSNNSACVKVNNIYTDWFCPVRGVRQGDILSPLLFSLFINDLAGKITDLKIGVKIDDMEFSILLYADDVLLIADNPNDLQKMLDTVEKWCKQWRLAINEDKSNIVHYRPTNTDLCSRQFKIGDIPLSYKTFYKYLGVKLTEHLDFSAAEEFLADSSGRALGSIIGKFKALGNVGYNTFSKLFDAGVVPVMDYAAGVWGLRETKHGDKVRNRAARYFLGVHRFAALSAMDGDIGWTSTACRRKIDALRLFNRFVDMSEDRTVKKLFKFDINSDKDKTWGREIRNLLSDLRQNNCIRDFVKVDLKEQKTVINNLDNSNWEKEIKKKPKLRTYITFKNSREVENYILAPITKNQRSLISQLRFGILPLAIETGRYSGLKPEERTCKCCNRNVIESEEHFLFFCNKFDNIRQNFYDEFSNINRNFTTLNVTDKFKTIFSKEYIKITAQFVERMWFARKDIFKNN